MKKDKKQKQPQQPVKVKVAGISATGKKIIAAGLVVLVLGYVILTRTDPAGQNWASILSPFLILGGYVLVGIGIIFPARHPEVSTH
jgi:hypothetical protein